MAICLYDKIKIPSQIDQIDIGPILSSGSSMEITGDNLRNLWRKSVFISSLCYSLFSHALICVLISSCVSVSKLPIRVVWLPPGNT